MPCQWTDFAFSIKKKAYFTLTLLVLGLFCSAASTKSLFNLYDRDQDGFLTQAEFEKFFQSFSCGNSSSTFILLDKSQDTFVDEQEFSSGNELLQSLSLINCSIPPNISEECIPPRPSESWIYGLSAAIAISLFSFIGVVLLPIESRWRDVLMEMMISFAIGALVGDSFLHLIPRALSESDGHENHGHDTPSMLKGLTICFAIYFFFLVEKTIKLVQRSGKKSKGEFDTLLHSGSHSDRSGNNVKSLGLLIIFSDGFHNFTDGIALGISFSTGNYTGFASAIAIACHEIPQELSDYTILVYSGFTKIKALLWNFLSACTSILGTVLGLLLGKEAGNSEPWLLAVVAGGFLYIALADLLPELDNKYQVTQIIRQSFGIFLGYGVMLLLSIFEPQGSC
eukprot:TRINITY_DN9871_c0_g1_i1.p1 TRINITY_DN9871_c0_g1~~TRINITY_DN9871_c0_g1_i1.p1  ORF type:complete len:396 (+),score=47.76 TRINITY_DN9871_c0_g1_i1:22-1209(+)